MIKDILRALNLSRYDVVKKKHGSVPQITAGELIESVIKYDTIPEIAQSFGVSIQTINRILRVNFPDVRLTGRRTWRYYFLGLIERKKCNCCEENLPVGSFYNNNHKNSLTNISSVCKSCDAFKTDERLKLVEDADIRIIAQIYAGCPKGYQVDHIIPCARGGTHHQDNLCYLPAKLNRAKSDKLPEEVPEIMAKAIYPKFSC